MNQDHYYQEALELTHKMLEYAKVQDWDGLTRLGTQRFELIQKAIEHRDALPTAEQTQIRGIIREIEQESAEIIERVQCWQEHVKILLRINKSTSSP